MNVEQLQKEICQKYNTDFSPIDINLKLGVADDFFSGEPPLNGLRHPSEIGTCGWFLWSGEEVSPNDDYVKPLHVYHLLKNYPKVLKYLALPVDWRFLIADDYEDVWFDEKLLDI